MQDSLYIGDTIDFEHDIDNSFSITFLPLDFFDHWERGSMLANFIAEYYHHNFPGEGHNNLISTVLNEFIENAVKFSRNNSMPVELTTRKRGDSLLMRMKNYLPIHRREPFVEMCRELFTRDLDDLYVERVQANSGNERTSGIGLILIRKDYSAALGFEFTKNETRGACVAVTSELNLR